MKKTVFHTNWTSPASKIKNSPGIFRLSAILVFFILLLCIPVLTSAQSNEIIDNLIAETSASYGKAAFLVLSAAEIIPEDADEEEAWAALSERGWNPKNRAKDNPIFLGEFSYIVMEAFNIKGGVMYTLFPSPRYASRELGFKEYIKSDPGAYRNMSGREALQILGRILRQRGQS